LKEKVTKKFKENTIAPWVFPCSRAAKAFWEVGWIGELDIPGFKKIRVNLCNLWQKPWMYFPAHINNFIIDCKMYCRKMF